MHNAQLTEGADWGREGEDEGCRERRGKALSRVTGGGGLEQLTAPKVPGGARSSFCKGAL